MYMCIKLKHSTQALFHRRSFHLSNLYIFQIQRFNKTKIHDIHTCTGNTRHITMHWYSYDVAHGNNAILLSAVLVKNFYISIMRD